MQDTSEVRFVNPPLRVDLEDMEGDMHTNKMVFTRVRWIVFAILLMGTSGLARADEAAIPQDHPLVPALKLARSAYETIAQWKGYEAVFAKREVVGREVSQHTMRIKVRHEPFSVYLGFYAPHEGREVIYVDKQNGGNMLVHETGIASIAGTISLLPTSPRALSESRYPITQIGIANMAKAVIENWELAAQQGEPSECIIKYYPNAQLGDVQCQVIECTHPQPRQHFKFHMTRYYIDKEANIPIRVEQYGFPARPNDRPPLLEEYTYHKIKKNPGLKDIDFDPRNPQYNY